MDNPNSNRRLGGFREWKFNLQVTDDMVNEANTAREVLLDSLHSENLKFGSGGTKIFNGELSPGCETCAEGMVSFFYINGLCTSNCFFCPQNRAMEYERSPVSAKITFNDPDIYVEYLQKCGMKGVGFTGGEPLLVLEKLLLFIKRIKKQFDRSIYTWIYTNGDLIDEQKLKELRNAGLDEIRFNLSARDYDIRPVCLARRFFDTVTVEIPAIPEDFDILQKVLPKMAEAGVKYLNLHNLGVSQYNFEKMSSRNYLIVPSLDHMPVVFESEMTALRLLKYAAEKHFEVSLNYCSQIFKQRYQTWGMRKQVANAIRADHEKTSGSGYITRLSVKDSKENLDKTISTFEQNGFRSSLWQTEHNNSYLFFHPDLIDLIHSTNNNLSLQYLEALVLTDFQRDENDFQKVGYIHAGADTKLVIGLKLVGKAENVNSGFVKTLLAKPIVQSGNSLSKESQTLKKLDSFERIEEGLPKLISTNTYWLKKVKQAFWENSRPGAMEKNPTEL